MFSNKDIPAATIIKIIIKNEKKLLKNKTSVLKNFTKEEYHSYKTF